MSRPSFIGSHLCGFDQCRSLWNMTFIFLFFLHFIISSSINSESPFFPLSLYSISCSLLLLPLVSPDIFHWQWYWCIPYNDNSNGIDNIVTEMNSWNVPEMISIVFNEVNKDVSFSFIRITTLCSNILGFYRIFCNRIG